MSNPATLGLTGTGNGSFDFDGQIAAKNSIKQWKSKSINGGGLFEFIDFGGTEKTETDGTVTVSMMNYKYKCNPGSPPGMTSIDSATWAPGLNVPSYRIGVPTKGTPAGSIEVTIVWKVYSPPPPGKAAAQAKWTTEKTILDEGLWVQVIDDGADIYGKSPNKFTDIIDLFVSDVDSAEREGMAVILDSVKKRDGFIQSKYNPLIIPGDFFLTSDTSQKAFNMNFRVKGIIFDWKAQQEPTCQYLVKERYFVGE